MTGQQSIEDRVKRLIAENLGVNLEEVRPDAALIDNLGADSLDVVELVMALEKEFGLDIPDEEAEDWTTVQDAIDYINDRG